MKENRTEEQAAAALRAGFTLIEILVAVAIIGILGTIATVSVPRMLEDSKIKAAQTAVRSLRDAVVSYNLSKGKYPSDLRQLIEASGDEDPIVEGGEGALEDPWGSNYQMIRKGKRIIITSAGPDGEPGTDDDIRSDETKKKSRD